MSIALPQRSVWPAPYGPISFPRISVRAPVDIWWWTLVAAICCLPVLMFLPFMSAPLMRDEAFYASVAQAMRDGAMPYEYGFDNKPPLIFYWYYASFEVFGENVWAPRLMASLLLSAGAGMLYAQGRILFSRAGGLVAAAIFGLSMGIAKFEVNANTEYFMIPFTILALLAFTLGQKRGEWYWYVLCGAACGVALMTKQTAVFMPIVFTAVVLHPTVRCRTLPGSAAAWRKLGLMTVGGAAVVAVVLAPFVVTGTLDEFYRSAFVYARQYTDDVTMWQKAQTMVWDAPRLLVKAAAPLMVLTAIGSMIMLRRPTAPGVWLAGWFLAAVAGLIAAGRFYPHYFVALLPGMALLSVPALQWAKENGTSLKTAAFAGVVVLASLGPLVTNAKIYFQSTPEERHLAQYSGSEMAVWENQSEKAGEWVRSMTRPGEKIYQFGFMPGIYFHSDREAPTQYIFKHPFAIDESYAKDAVQQLESDMPVLIFDSAAFEDDGSFAYHGETITDFMEANYDYIGKRWFGEVWALKGWEPLGPFLPLEGELSPSVVHVEGTLRAGSAMSGTLRPGVRLQGTLVPGVHLLGDLTPGTVDLAERRP